MVFFAIGGAIAKSLLASRISAVDLPAKSERLVTFDGKCCILLMKACRSEGKYSSGVRSPIRSRKTCRRRARQGFRVGGHGGDPRLAPFGLSPDELQRAQRRLEAARQPDCLGRILQGAGDCVLAGR